MAEAPSPPSGPTAAQPAPLRVLIADENPVARRFLSRVVCESFSEPAEVIESSDTHHALQRLSPDIDLLLVEQQLPEGGAEELLRRAAGHPALKVVTTLYSDDDRLFDLIRLGASGYLLTEDRFEVQLEQLQRIVQGMPPLSPAIARCALAALGGGSASAPGALDGLPQVAVGLDPEEADVLQRLSRGYTLREVAHSLSLRPRTVAGHIADVYRKLHRSVDG